MSVDPKMFHRLVAFNECLEVLVKRAKEAEAVGDKQRMDFIRDIAFDIALLR
ncbi:hypothetical protein [Corynebacterium kalidii]|uniref:Uncharacterized protein n=1 Tax=Corynebacterium kalidii TaxID=2931982 RepID=A0A9X1WQ56_9CORY|nr:hypothetical protein [Corynebacterium kalidii]MCJ7859231.1 hypothetical protein [Corynebacterium kalidii]